MKKRQNGDVLPSVIDLNGKKVADIGCGEGSLTRLMTRHGASVIGVECSKDQLARALSAKPAGNEIYTEGIGEELSFEDEKLDLVVFFNSLHHIDISQQDKALQEAARVLKTGGQVYVCEPLAEGEHFELMKPVHDETEVRTAAYQAIGRAGQHGLRQEMETKYAHTSSYPDYAAFRDQIQNINPHLNDQFDDLQETLKSNFESLGRQGEKGREFFQPMRVNLMIKTN